MQVPFADPLLGLEPQNTILPLVGREMEMQMVSALLDIVVQDKPVGARALMISGEPGIGKSRMLAEMYQEARAQGFTLLEARAYEMGRMFPYLPFVEALRPVVRTFTLQQLRRYTGLAYSETDPASSNISLTGLPLVTALSQLFPELTLRLGLSLPTREPLSPDQEKFRLFDSIATLLEHIALEQPVLLSIDNLQWADSASLELTMYLTVRLHRSRVVLVGATRPTPLSSDQEEEPPTATARAMKILGELMRQGLLLFLPLGPLSERAALQHLHSLLPGVLSDDIASSLLYRAEGNPYVLEELVRTLVLREALVSRNSAWQAQKPLSAGALPQSITWVVEECLQGLKSRELLQVAALFGRTFPQTPLIQVFGKTPEQTQLLLDEAMQQNVIARVAQEDILQNGREVDTIAASPPASAFIFCRGIVQEALRAEASPQRAILLHGAIGTALEAYYGTTAPAHAAELARHYVLGDQKTEALSWSLRAGEEATRQQAHREAISHLRVVLRLLEAGTQPANLQNRVSITQISLALGESWLKLGELALATDAFQQALEKHREVSEGEREQIPLLLAKANRLLGDVYRMQGKYELALAHLQAASNVFEKDEDNGSFQEAENDGHIVTSWLSSERSYAHLSRAADNTSPSHTALLSLNATERLLLLQARATLDLLLFQPEKAETELWRAYQLATEIGDRGSQAFALHFLGWLRGWGEHIAEATRLISQARDLYIANGDPFHAVLGDQSLGIIYQARGEMEKARFHNLHGFEQARRYGIQQVVGWLHCNQGAMALAQGNWEECELHLQNALQDAEEQSNARLKAFATQAQALLHARRGNWEQAEHVFQAALQAAVDTEWYPSTLALYGHFLAVTGRESASLVQLELAAREPEPPGYSGHFYIPFLAEAHLHLPKNQQAATYIEQIRNLRGLCYYGVSIDRILGEVAAQQGDWETAERAFEDGLILCQRSHNRPEEAAILYEQARTVLMRSRVEPPSQLNFAISRIHDLCQHARSLFLEYSMQRAVDLIDTLQEGVDQINRSQTEEVPQPIAPAHLAHAGYQLELRLTRRELEVLRLVAEGQTDREVADALVLSPRTVNRHLSNIFTKLDVPGRAAAVAYAIRQGLVK
jgi:predicted ATPase/DNA-binding CsgD family transcriptional regulator